jgi:hypothetical protein
VRRPLYKLLLRIIILFRFSAFIMGICNTSGNMAGIFAPVAIGFITEDVSVAA